MKREYLGGLERENCENFEGCLDLISSMKISKNKLLPPQSCASSVNQIDPSLTKLANI